MVFKDSVVRVRIARLEEVISELEKLRRMGGGALRNSLSQMWSVERGLQLGAELIFDIGNHILNAQYGISPVDYKDIVRQLAQQSILGEDLLARLEGMAGFRNIIVHDYLRLDPEKVLAALEEAPRDFGDFALAIRDWLGDRPR